MSAQKKKSKSKKAWCIFNGCPLRFKRKHDAHFLVTGMKEGK